LVGIHQTDCEAIYNRILDEIQACVGFRSVQFSPLIYKPWDDYLHNVILPILSQPSLPIQERITRLSKTSHAISLPLAYVGLFFKTIIPFVLTEQVSVTESTIKAKLEPLHLFDYVFYRHTFYNSFTTPTQTVLSFLHLVLRANGFLWINALSTNRKQLQKFQATINQFGFDNSSLDFLLPQIFPHKAIITKLFSSHPKNCTYLLDRDFCNQDNTKLFECINNVFTNSYQPLNECHCESASILKWLSFSTSHITSFYVEPVHSDDLDDIPLNFDEFRAVLTNDSFFSTHNLNEQATNTHDETMRFEQLAYQHGIVSPVVFERLLFLLHNTTTPSNSSLLEPISALFQFSVCPDCDPELALEEFAQTSAVKSMFYLQQPEIRREMMLKLEAEYSSKTALPKDDSLDANFSPTLAKFHQQYPLLFNDDTNPTNSDIIPDFYDQIIEQANVQQLQLKTSPQLLRPPSPSFYYYSMQDDDKSLSGSNTPAIPAIQLPQTSGLQSISLLSPAPPDVSDAISTDFSFCSALPKGDASQFSLQSTSVLPNQSFHPNNQSFPSPSPLSFNGLQRTNSNYQTRKRSIPRNSSSNNLSGSGTGLDSPLLSSTGFPQLAANKSNSQLLTPLTQHTTNSLSTNDLRSLTNPAVQTEPTGNAPMSLQQLHTLQVQQSALLPTGPSNGNTQQITKNVNEDGTPVFLNSKSTLRLSSSRFANPFWGALRRIFQLPNARPFSAIPNSPLLNHFVPAYGVDVMSNYLGRNINSYLYAHGLKSVLFNIQKNMKPIPSNLSSEKRVDDESFTDFTLVEPASDVNEDGDDKNQVKIVPTIVPDCRPIVESRPRILVSGYSIGLPNSTNPDDKDLPGINYDRDHINRPVFSPNNIDKLLAGYSYLSSYTLAEHTKMLAMNPFELGKSPDGKRIKKVYQSPEECIQIQSKISSFDLSSQYGVPGYVVEALDMAFQLAIAAGLEALVDSGYPVLSAEKIWVQDTSSPDGGNWSEKITINQFPSPLRPSTGIIFVSSFPGMDSIVDEVERCSISQMRTEVIRMLKEHPLATTSSPLKSNHTISPEDLDSFNEVVDKLDKLTESSPNSPIKSIPDKIQKTNIFQDLISSLELHPVYEYNRKLLFKVLVMANSQLAELLSITGPNTHVNAACAGTTQAIAIADDWIRQTRRCEAVVVISADIATSKRLLPYISTGFMVLGAATKIKGVVNGSAPFDSRRKGMIVGAGAAAIVLETHYRMLQRQSYDITFPDHSCGYDKHGSIITNVTTHECEIHGFDFEPLPKWNLEPLTPPSTSQTHEKHLDRPSPWNLSPNWVPKGELLLSHYANSAFHASLIHSAHISQELTTFLHQAEMLYGARLRAEWEADLLCKPICVNPSSTSSHLTPSITCLGCLKNSVNEGDDHTEEYIPTQPLVFPWKRELSKQLLYFSHETSTASCAKVEMAALRNYFGPDLLSNIIVCNTKGFTGHAMGVAFEDVVAVAALHKQIVPAIANLRNKDPMFKEVTLSPGGPIQPINHDLFSRLYDDYQQQQFDKHDSSSLQSLVTSTHTVNQCSNCTPMYPTKRTLSLRFSAGFGSQLVFLLFKEWREDNCNELPLTSDKLPFESRYKHSYDIVPVLHPNKRDEVWRSFSVMLSLQQQQIQSLQQVFAKHMQLRCQIPPPNDSGQFKLTLQNQKEDISRAMKHLLYSTLNPSTVNLVSSFTDTSSTNPSSEVVSSSSTRPPQSQSGLLSAAQPPPTQSLLSLNTFGGWLPHPSQLSLPRATTKDFPSPRSASSELTPLQTPTGQLRSRPSFESGDRLQTLMHQSENSK